MTRLAAQYLARVRPESYDFKIKIFFSRNPGRQIQQGLVAKMNAVKISDCDAGLFCQDQMSRSKMNL